MSLATDIKAQVADISAKADAILAKLAQAKAEALTPEDLAALQAAQSGLSEVQGKLG